MPHACHCHCAIMAGPSAAVGGGSTPAPFVTPSPGGSLLLLRDSPLFEDRVTVVESNAVGDTVHHEYVIRVLRGSRVRGAAAQARDGAAFHAAFRPPPRTAPCVKPFSASS